jgi:hypothetical protein
LEDLVGREEGLWTAPLGPRCPMASDSDGRQENGFHPLAYFDIPKIGDNQTCGINMVCFVELSQTDAFRNGQIFIL